MNNFVKFTTSEPGVVIKASQDPFYPTIYFEHTKDMTATIGVLADRLEIKKLGDICSKLNYHPSEPLSNELKARIFKALTKDGEKTEEALLLAEVTAAYEKAILPPAEGTFESKLPGLVRALLHQINLCDYTHGDESVGGPHEMKRNIAYINLKKYVEEMDPTPISAAAVKSITEREPA